MPTWLENWLGTRQIGFSKTWKFSWPDAGGDKCQKCGVERRAHEGQDHPFAEKGDS